MILSLDIGTSRVKGGLFSPQGRCLATASAPLPLHASPDPLAHEAEAADWVRAITTIALTLLAGRTEVSGIVVSGNGPTLLPVDADGLSLHPALTWMDRRAVAEAAEATDLAGTWIDSSFYLPKALWFARHRPAIHEKTASYLACPEYIIRLLTGRAVTVFPRGYEALYWKEEWLAKFGLDRAKFPPFVEPGNLVGLTEAGALGLGIPAGVPVVAGGPDFLAALIGTATTLPGRVCDRAGSSEGINLCSSACLDEPRLLTKPHIVRPWYNVSGAVSTSGKAVEWFKRATGPDDEDYETLLRAAETAKPGSGGLLFLPYLAGERAPLWDSSARGAFVGLTLAQGRPEMTRAVLESTALAIRDVIGVMEEAGAEVSELRVTGKPGSSPFWNQLKADVSGKPVLLPRFGESELLGGACMAFTALGRYAGLAEAAEDLVTLGRRHEPNPALKGLYDELFGLYRESYAALRPLFPRLGELCGITSPKTVDGGGP